MEQLETAKKVVMLVSEMVLVMSAVVIVVGLTAGLVVDAWRRSRRR
jgi:hypothetical protein